MHLCNAGLLCSHAILCLCCFSPPPGYFTLCQHLQKRALSHVLHCNASLNGRLAGQQQQQQCHREQQRRRGTAAVAAAAAAVAVSVCGSGLSTNSRTSAAASMHISLESLDRHARAQNGMKKITLLVWASAAWRQHAPGSSLKQAQTAVPRLLLHMP